MLENCLHEKIIWKKDYCWSSGSLYMNMCLFCVAGWHGICPFHWKISVCLFWIFWCEVWYHSQLNKPCKVDQGDFSFIPFLLWPTKSCANETYKTAVNATNLLFTLNSCFPLLLSAYIGICIQWAKTNCTCKQAINSLDAYTRTKLESGLVYKFKNLLASNFLPLWNWDSLYAKSLFTIWKGIYKKMSNNYGLGLYQLAAVGTASSWLLPFTLLLKSPYNTSSSHWYSTFLWLLPLSTWYWNLHMINHHNKI
jgi:hypothetical protein